MLIKRDECIGCEKCIPYCPVNSLKFEDDNTVAVDLELCVECGVCLRSGICIVDAIYQQELEWPRILRSIFSNVRTVAPNTALGGRGTEEMKTNDVTKRFKKGFVGVGIELGRPGIGTRLKEAEKITLALAGKGVTFEKENPVYDLFSNPVTGKFKEEVLNERVLSLVLEFVIPKSQLSEILSTIKDVTPELDTVFSLDIIVKAEDDGSVDLTIVKELERLGYTPALNGKTNLGLGKVSNMAV